MLISRELVGAETDKLTNERAAEKVREAAVGSQESWRGHGKKEE